VGASTLQHFTALSRRDANLALRAATRLLLLAPQGAGYWPAALVCRTCYRRVRLAFDQAVAREESPAARSPIPATLRFEVFRRDGFKCKYCGRSEREGAVLHVDHVVPFSRGGTTTEDNLITACSDCNLGKSDRPVLPI